MTPCSSSGATTRWWSSLPTPAGSDGGSQTGTRYGVSGFVARNADEVDALCETRLAAWATVLVFRRAAVQAVGIEVVPTFRNPHVTLAHPELGELIEWLACCEHEVLDNPYHEGESSRPET